MAEITRERAGQIVRAIFEVLHQHPDGLRARDAIEAAASRLTLTEYELGAYPSAPGRRRFDKIAQSATVGPAKAGWMAKSKGTWTLADEGWRAHEQFPDPAEFMREASGRDPARRRSRSQDVEPVEAAEVASRAAAIYEQAAALAWSEIETYLRAMPACELQELLACLLRAMGYHASRVAPRGRDGNVDLVAFTEPHAGQVERIKVRIQRVDAGRVDAADLRAFIDVVDGRDVGVVVALDGYSADAEAEARSHEAHRLTLLDLAGVFDLWVEHYEQLTEDARRRLPLRPVHFLDPR